MAAKLQTKCQERRVAAVTSREEPHQTDLRAGSEASPDSQIVIE